MTTIVYRDGVMATDSLVSCDGVSVGAMRKMVRTPKGGLAAAAGRLGAVHRFLTWVEAGCTEPLEIETDEAFDGFVVSPDGKIYVTEAKYGLVPMSAPYHAVGSGREFALGACAMGASADEAVKAAMKFDQRTGGRVKRLVLDKQ